MKKNNAKKFEESYFEGHYRSNVGEFSKQRDNEMKNWFRGSFEFVNKYVPIKASQGKTLLEFGCAYGSASSILAGYGLRVTATDISNLAINRAKKLHPDIAFKTHDMQKSYKSLEKFDYVLAMDVIEHLEKPEKAIGYVYRELKPGGIAIISTQNDFPYEVQDPTHISVKSPKEWKRMLKKAGFSQVKVQPATYFPPRLYRYHWRLNVVLPFAMFSTIFLSTVFIFAKK